jgi:hypothetical protein
MGTQARTLKGMFSVAWRCAALALLLGAWPNVAGAQGASLRTTRAEELRAAFVRRGYDVDPTATWDWLSPQVTSFRVHNPQTRRVLLVNIYENTAVAAAEFERAPGFRYDASTWLGEATLLESDASSTERTTIECDPAALPAGTWSAELPNAPNVDVDDQYVHIVLEVLHPGELEQNQ